MSPTTAVAMSALRTSPAGLWRSSERMLISASTLRTWPWLRSSTMPSTMLTRSAATSISQWRRSFSGNLQARPRMAPDSHVGGSAVPKIGVMPGRSGEQNTSTVCACWIGCPYGTWMKRGGVRSIACREPGRTAEAEQACARVAELCSERRQRTAMLDLRLGSSTPKLLKRIGRRSRKKEHHVVIQMSPPAGTIVAAMKLKILVACSELHDVPRIRALGSKLVRRLLNRASNKFTSRRMSYLLLRDSVNERSAAWRGQTLNYA